MTLTEVESPLKSIMLDVAVNGIERPLILRSFPTETPFEHLFIFRIQTGIIVNAKTTRYIYYTLFFKVAFI